MYTPPLMPNSYSVVQALTLTTKAKFILFKLKLTIANTNNNWENINVLVFTNI